MVKSCGAVLVLGHKPSGANSLVDLTQVAAIVVTSGHPPHVAMSQATLKRGEVKVDRERDPRYKVRRKRTFVSCCCKSQ